MLNKDEYQGYNAGPNNVVHYDMSRKLDNVGGTRDDISVVVHFSRH